MNAYHSEKYIREALDSVLNQTFQDFEVLVWENESQDATREIIQELADERVQYFFDPIKVSLYESRINAIRQARGDLVAFLDCDDIWLPEKLQVQIPCFEDRDCVLSCSDVVVFREENRLAGQPNPGSIVRTYRNRQTDVVKIFHPYRVAMSTLVVRRSSLLETLGGDVPAFTMIEDVDIVTRLMTVGFLMPVPRVTALYRRHLTNYSARTNAYGDELIRWIQKIPEMGFTPEQALELMEWANNMDRRTRISQDFQNRRFRDALRRLSWARDFGWSVKALAAAFKSRMLFPRET